MSNNISANGQSTLSYGDEHMGKPGKFRWHLRFGVAFALLSLTACQTTATMEPVESTAYTSRHPIVVTNDVVAMKVQSGRNKLGLTRAQRARIRSFVSAYKDTGTGPLKINSPSSVVNDVLAAGAVAEVRRIIEASSIPRSRLRMVNYYPRNPRVSSPVIISYRRYAAITNKCGAWPESNAITYENKPVWSFGCATQNNLAAMIANPRDLVEPRQSTPGDAQRRDKVFAKYREGEVSTAKRSKSGSGTVSNVAK